MTYSILPVITQISPATFGLADIMTALHTHFNSVSTLFDVDLLSADGAGVGFVITSVADPTPQYSFRRVGASDVFVQIEPSGSLTAAGTTAAVPAGASADASPVAQKFILGTLSGSSKLWLCEFADAFTLLMTSSAGTSWQPGIHMGRIYVPDVPSIDESRGRDGLGFFLGAPDVLAAGSDWLGSGQLVTGGRVHVATGIWDEPAPAGGNTPGTSDAMFDNATVMGYIRPGTVGLSIDSLSSDTPIGTLKYVFRSGSSDTPMKRKDLDNDTALAWIHGGAVGNTSTLKTCILPWLRTVTP